MAGKVGEAYVEIVADYSKFVKTSATELRRALREVATKADMSPITEEFGKAGQRAAVEYATAYEEASRAEQTRVQRSARQAGRATTREFVEGADEERRRRASGDTNLGTRFARDVLDGADRETGRRGSLLSRLFPLGAAGETRQAANQLIGIIGGGAASIGRGLGSIGSEISGALNAIPILGTVVKVVAGLAAILPALGGIWGLVDVLVSLVGVLALLPGALAVGAAAFVAATLAFDGFGEAISALASGDLEKINEAMAKLSPSAQRVAREVGAIIPVFKELKKSIQEGLFGEIDPGRLTAVFKNLGPTVAFRLREISAGLGNFIDQFLAKLSTPGARGLFDDILFTTSLIIEENGPKLLSFLTSIGKMIQASLPFVAQLADLLGDTFQEFGDFITGAIEDGSFQEFLAETITTLKDIKELVIAVIGLFATLFGDTEQGGKTFLDDTTAAINGLTQFFESPTGQIAIEGMIDLVKLFGVALLALVIIFATIIESIRKVKNFAEENFDRARKAVGWFSTALWNLTTPISNLIGWLNRLADRILSIPVLPNVLGGIGGAIFGLFAQGGIVNRPTAGIVGEAGPEVVIPLSRPQRARELMEESGLLSLTAGMTDGGQTVVNVYMGTEKIAEFVDVRVDKGMDRAAKQLAQGVR